MPEGKGIVSGDGLYWDGDTVTMTVTPLPSYIFHYWEDGNEDNPRHFTIEQDTVFTAYIGRREDMSVDTVADAVALFTLTPNPTTGSVRCIRGEGTFVGGELTMADATGRELLRQEVSAMQADVEIDLSHLPAGTYFVTLATADGSCTKKLVIK